MTGLPDVFLRRPLAHRALHDLRRGRPENSVAAIRAAMQAGYGIEIDLQLSRDETAMVFHDYDLRRLTSETGPVRARGAEDLRRIILNGADEGIPTFSDVLAIVAGRVPLLVELKDQHGGMGQTDGMLERAVAEDLRGYDGPVALMSFNPEMVMNLANLSPDVPRGLVTCAFRVANWPMLPAETRTRLREIPDYERAGCSFISHDISDLDRPRVAKLKSDGAVLLCWTVRSRAAEARARRVADNVTFEGYLPEILP